jgi:hypothetical protein
LEFFTENDFFKELKVFLQIAEAEIAADRAANSASICAFGCQLR